MNTQAKVALDKQAHPERYCKEPRCLWKVQHLETRSMGEEFIDVHVPNVDCPNGRCPRHQRKSQ